MVTERRVLVGRIVGLYGVHGGVKIESWTEPRLRIFDYQPWQLGADQDPGAVIVGVSGRAQGKGLVANLPGIESREQAAILVGRDIFVARTALPPPAAGEYYWADLEGVAVFTVAGLPLGRVNHLFATGANDVLVVRDDDRERLIPFVQGAVVKAVDLRGGRLVVDWDPDF